MNMIMMNVAYSVIQLKVLRRFVVSAGLIFLSLAGYSQITLEYAFKTGENTVRKENVGIDVVILFGNRNPLRQEEVNTYKSIGNFKTSYYPDVFTQRYAGLPNDASQFDGFRIETYPKEGTTDYKWDLLEFTVTVVDGRYRTVIFTQKGDPILSTFTPAQNAREFRIRGLSSSMSKITPKVTNTDVKLKLPGSPVMTNFKPAIHGFKFANRFKNIIVSGLDWTSSGACSGMVYAAFDYYKKGKPIPPQTYQPAEGTILQSYIYNRQIKQITDNWDKWAEYGFNPNGMRNSEFFNWGLQFGNGRLGELMRKIDEGEPVPIGLQEYGGKHAGNHYVLAIGYALGKYNGDQKTNIKDLTIYIYDPNFPGRTMKLKPNPDFKGYELEGEDPYYRWRAYFVDYKYSISNPPEIRDIANEISVEFTTGGDDLRGGRNDNVHMVIVLKSGQEIRFDNVNGGQRWINYSLHGVGRSLPASVTSADQIKAIRLETRFTGGHDGDNWELQSVKVSTRIGGGNPREILYLEGKPLFRFTGDRKTRTFEIGR
ncbi:MAG: hypothetical protein KIT66_01025 [Chitinophagaceae bacterium]|nr:hypothetical protein [Chitinophagaceae bacterium]